MTTTKGPSKLAITGMILLFIPPLLWLVALLLGAFGRIQYVPSPSLEIIDVRPFLFAVGTMMVLSLVGVVVLLVCLVRFLRATKN